MSKNGSRNEGLLKTIECFTTKRVKISENILLS